MIIQIGKIVIKKIIFEEKRDDLSVNKPPQDLRTDFDSKQISKAVKNLTTHDIDVKAELKNK